MRLIVVSDVYELDRLPSLRTLVQEESKCFLPGNVITCLPGDFLAPSLLSSLDAGHAMVKILNRVPIDMVCFGNHDGNDIPSAKLAHRVQEFKGVWLNSNLPGFQPELPQRAVRELTGEDGTPGVRKVAFLGFCIGGGQWKAIYGDDAFCGFASNFIPVLEALPEAVSACRAAHPDVAEIIPMTHQDAAQDVEMAKTGLFPVILGGHDHDLMSETHGPNGCCVMKAGMDATHAAIVDLEWTSLERSAQPSVTVTFKAVDDYAPDASLAQACEHAKRPVRELECATLYVLPPGEVLSSVNARQQDVTMAQKLATCVRDCLRCDAAVINSGTVRGNKEYRESVSYGDLRRECPFSSGIVVVTMPFSVLRDGVLLSRKPWAEAEAVGSHKNCASALQVDEGISIVQHAPTTILGMDPDEVVGELYSVAVDTYVLRKNLVFREYCQQYPDRVPPEDCGRPLLPILVEYFCASIWRQLIEGKRERAQSPSSVRHFMRAAKRRALGVRATDVPLDHARDLGRGAEELWKLLDKNGDGYVDCGELLEGVRSILGERLSSEIVIQQLMQLVDENADGLMSKDELFRAITKVAPRKLPRMREQHD